MDTSNRDGDQFNVILEAALRSKRSRAKASILYSDGRFLSGIATADVQLNRDNAPMVQLTINIGGCRAAGFDDVGAALRIAQWKPVEELEVLDAMAVATSDEEVARRRAYFESGLELRPSGLPRAT